MNEISEMKADMVKHLAILLMNHNKDLKINAQVSDLDFEVEFIV